MRSLPIIKRTIDQELAAFPKKLSDQFGDDTFIRLSHEEEALKELLAITDQLIQKQIKLEEHLDSCV
jgi:hypothetical protein